MMFFHLIVLAVNLLVAVVFGLDYFVIDSPKAKPRTKARLGVLLAFLFLLLLVLLVALCVVGVAVGRNPAYLVLAVYVLIPWVIGRAVSYRTLRFYAALQFLAFLLSAATVAHLARIAAVLGFLL